MSRQSAYMLLKHSSTQVKDLNSEKGIVEAYANAYGNEDSDGDISVPGCFKKTVEEQRRRIRVFKDHDRYTTLGVPLEIDAGDSFGLRTVTKFNMQKDVSRDMFTDIKLFLENDLNADLSVGVIPIERDSKDQRKVLQWKLREYSFLSSWGANDLSTVQNFKTEDQKQKLIKIITEAYDLDYSDQRLKEIEKHLIALDDNQAAPVISEAAQGHLSDTLELTLLNHITL